MSTFVDVEGMQNAARRMEAAADKATRAAESFNEAITKLSHLTDRGYGNNFEKLIELLEKQESQG
jgi:hypothetical protein